MGRARGKKRKSSCKSVPLKKIRKATNVEVDKCRYPARRYEQFHDKFLTPDEIKTFLCRIQKAYPSKVQLQVIGRSNGGKAIYMAIISDGTSSTSGHPSPKMATMIEAGSNGDEWMTISTALFLIDYLAKNVNLVKIMDYFIIPCLNPDAYECSLCNSKKSNVSMNLSKNYPLLLGTSDMKLIKTEEFLKVLRAWKEAYNCNSPEVLALIRTLSAYQFATKLFISLQGDGTAIAYPYGFCNVNPAELADLKKVANAGQVGIRTRCFQVGSIYSLFGLTYGTLIDFLRLNRSSVKFAYIIHVNKKQKKLDPCKIMTYGQEILNCVRFMARNVYMFYTKVNQCKSFSFILCFGTF